MALHYACYQTETMLTAARMSAYRLATEVCGGCPLCVLKTRSAVLLCAPGRPDKVLQRCVGDATWCTETHALAPVCTRQDQIKYLVSVGCIKPLCDLLICSDARIVTVALEGIENILKARAHVPLSAATNTLGDAGISKDVFQGFRRCYSRVTSVIELFC